MSAESQATAVLLPHQRYRKRRVLRSLNWRRLAVASAVAGIASFACVHVAMNAPLSKEQSFINECRKLNGLVIKDQDGSVMDNKLICLRREALLGWHARD